MKLLIETFEMLTPTGKRFVVGYSASILVLATICIVLTILEAT